MSRITRRSFFGTTAALPFGLAAYSSAAKADNAIGHADIIVTGGNLITMDPAQPTAEAMAIRGKHILAVGSADDIANLAGPNTQRIDARGMTVTPGFIDSHSHPLLAEEAVEHRLPGPGDVRRTLDFQFPEPRAREIAASAARRQSTRARLTR